MQRRAAAAYFLFFLAVSVAAYAYIGVAESQRPAVELEGPELTNDSTFTSGGQTYTVSNVQMSGGGGGHGGGGSMAAELSWTNNSSQYTGTIEAGSTVTQDNTTYDVSIDNATGALTLTAQQNVTQLLQDDSAVYDSLATRDGTDYVVYRANNSTQPVAEWLPDPETVTYTTGDQYPYQAEGGTQTTTITNVTNSSATVEWIAPRQNTVELSEGGNVTLADGQYFAHFPDHSTVQVVSTDQYSQYQETLAAQSYFHERKNGLWGISILSGIASVLMLGMAYLPNRG
ncbi:hypothetical protein [Haloarcula salinisoli]|uniref:Uncharacterized protein n=1 Tax=Haloarcula salinisoli TaxID=2487746 RepID=A0A8J7YNV5_9EURY|nr:hypothetical protein [Halomicroarcula salinisoli]MBX0288079.1 hypothetical protein [Halomicroarcula salinisoli]MBX0305211.1 hypothetical protein [Halomicroarcula salinisoli]